MPGGRLDFGQEVTCRVTYLREDGRINVSMRLQKENALVADAQDIYDFLVKRNGSMPYCDSTPLEIIKQKFGISKAAFKRALGHLMKEGKVRRERLDLSDGRTARKVILIFEAQKNLLAEFFS